MVKIKLPKKTLWHGIILNTVNKNLWRLICMNSQADPTTEN